jgi:hypothetical protein
MIGMIKVYSVRKAVMMIALAAVVAIALLAIPASAQETRVPNGLEQLKFLSGDWVGAGGGAPGQGTGEFSFTPDLQGQVIVRKSYAEYPATKDKAAYRHDDLTVIYQLPGDTMRAVYFDNENHVINYTLAILPDEGKAIFVSAPSASAPRFRLTYTKTKDDTVALKFEIAPPGQPEAFAPYIESTARRK